MNQSLTSARRASRRLACFSLFSATLALSAADWPQYRGPNFDGSTAERIQSVWPSGGPRHVWTSPTPGGFSSFAVAGGRAFTLVERAINGANSEVCLALDAEKGTEVWAAPVGIAKYDGGGDAGAPGNDGGDGPRSTPAVQGDRVYVLSAAQQLFCLNADDGKTRWKKDLPKEFGARNISWQSAASPVLDGKMVFVCAGGSGQSLLAFDATTGDSIWKSESDTMTHATPVVADILGQRQVIFLTQSGLVAVAPANGKVLWRYKFPYRVSTASSPVVGGDIVYCSAGYGVGAGAVRITRAGDEFTAKEIWRTSGKLMNHWSTPVQHNGYLYGLFGFKQYGRVPLKCVELATGKEMWSKDGFGQGGTILAGNHVVALAENGQLVIVEANPKAYTETARHQAVSGKCWNNAAVSHGRIYARSTKEAVCLDVAVRNDTR